jgi:arsenate reductase (thioredoxin)
VNEPHPLGRRLFAEFLGTGLLVTAVVGSGIAAQRMSPNDIGLELFENAAATAAALIAIILALSAISGAHLNPVVSIADRLLGGHRSWRDTGAYIVAQIAGGIVGVMIANLMFALPAVELSTKARSEGHLWLSEVVATFGLLLVIFGMVRAGREHVIPFAVGAYIGAAYFFTSSTSFANPAVTIARTLTNTFSGIEPSSAPMFIVFQLVGCVIAIAAIRILYPRQGGIMKEVPEVLFVCVHNAGRSQMAAALLDHRSEGRVHVRSAGSDPADKINPAVAEAMLELGVDISKEFPKPLTDEVVRAADVVITMGCGDACPIYLGKRYLDWDLEDPAGKSLDDVRPIRDEIDRRVVELLGELSPQESSADRS